MFFRIISDLLPTPLKCRVPSCLAGRRYLCDTVRFDLKPAMAANVKLNFGCVQHDMSLQRRCRGHYTFNLCLGCKENQEKKTSEPFNSLEGMAAQGVFSQEPPKSVDGTGMEHPHELRARLSAVVENGH